MRARADAGLEESAEDLYENAPCGYLSTAEDGTIVRVNATFERWTGHRREDLIGVKRFQDLLTVGGRMYHETHYAPLLLMQGSVREIAVTIVGADGRRLPVLVNSALVRDAEGAPGLIRTTVFDASERKLYERELLAARDRERAARERTERLQRLTAALAAAPDADGVAAAVAAELVPAFGAERAGIDGPGAGGAELFDEGAAGQRPAAVRLGLGTPSGASGVLWLEFAGPRGFAQEEQAFLRASAAQTTLALERSRLYEETRDVSHSLQRSLLAGAPPRDSRFEVATLYQPAIEHLDVGGDWHDAFRLGGDRVGIVVGDVVGRGLGAASAMGQLRSAIRALAGAGLEPAAVLGHLDTFVDQVDAARYATVVFADVDLATGGAVLASAGHLPPVIIEPGSPPRLFMDGRSPPLGIPARDGTRPQSAFRLRPGAGFLLYTDGLVERRGEAIDTGLERLLEAIRAVPDPSPAELAHRLPEALLEPAAAGDDVCLLGFRLCRG